jgi:serine/threonine protein phosphatase PrpC
VRAGILDASESLHSEHQNVLLRSLGHERDVDVTMTEVPLQPGNLLLLCTDGLTRMVPDEEVDKIIARFSEPQAICDALVAEANRNGGVDNVTAVAVEVANRWWSGLWRRRRRHEVGQNDG